MPPAKIEPGRDPEMAQRTISLNLVFALSSIGLLIALSLMIWADYDRDWKKYQTRFNKLEVKATQEQIEAALGKMDARRRQELEQAITKGKEEGAGGARRSRRPRPRWTA